MLSQNGLCLVPHTLHWVSEDHGTDSSEQKQGVRLCLDIFGWCTCPPDSIMTCGGLCAQEVTVLVSGLPQISLLPSSMYVCTPSLSSKRLSWWRWWGHHHCGARAFLSFPCLGTGIPKVLCLVSAAAPFYPRLREPVLFSLPLMLNFLSQTSLLGCGKL